MKKRLAAMAMGMIMCIGFAAQNVDAASCPPHDNTKTYTAPVSHWTTTHKVYRNEYVGGQQVYSLCTVTHDVVRYTMYCMDCGKKLSEDDVERQTHSLASDPDHR